MAPEPTPFAGEMAAAAATGIELFLLALAGYLVLSKEDRTPSEAAACALLLPLLFLSAVFQAVFIAGVPKAALPIELLAVAVSIGVVYRHRALLFPLFAQAGGLVSAHPVISASAGAALLYLLAQALAVPPGSTHWIDLAPMAHLEARGGFFPRPPIAEAMAIDPLGAPVNQTILFHLLLRTGADRGLGLLGFAAYLSIGLSTYALARRYAWPPTALAASLVVMSLPRLVVQATGPGVELMAAAAAVAAIVCLYRLLEQPNSTDLLLLILFLVFSISGREMRLALPLVLGALSVILLYRRHGGRIWRRLLSETPARTLATFFPAVLLSQLWLPLADLFHKGPTAAALHSPNAGGLKGALANLIRYGLESVHLTLPVEHLARWMFGFSPMKLLEGIYHWAITPFLGQAGAAVPFSIRWLPDETFSWFGPFGVVLVVPAVAYALWRGPRRIKAVALALVVYGYLVALVPAWQPGNARFFTGFFVCGGFCVAFFLPPWRLTTPGRHLLQALSIALIVYAGAMNSARPLLGHATWIESLYPDDGRITADSVLQSSRHSIWTRVMQNQWQFAECRGLFGDDRVERVVELIGADHAVAVLAARPERAYPLLLRGDRRRIVPLHPAISADDLRALGVGYLFYLDYAPDPAPATSGMRMLWSAGRRGALPGALFRLDAESSVHVVGPEPGGAEGAGRPPERPSAVSGVSSAL